MRLVRSLAYLAMSSALLFAVAVAAEDNDLPYLSSISIERAPGDAATFTGTLLSTLHVRDPDKSALLLSRISGLEIVNTGQDTVSIEFGEEPTMAGDADEQFRQSSWVVDYDEDTVQALVEQLGASLDTTPAANDLRQYVHGHIRDKTYKRAFDLASQVASTGAGDCTEHAVLLAALARAHGYYARVALGTLILDTDSGLFAFGHAWTEIHDGNAWRIMDATMPDNEPSLRQLRYLPVAILSNEGPGYFASLIDTLSSMPVRITGLMNSP